MEHDDKHHPKEIWLHPACDRCRWLPDWDVDPHECTQDECSNKSVRYVREDVVSGEFQGI